MADLLDQVAKLPDRSRRDEALAAGAPRLDALQQGLAHPLWRVRRWSCRLLEDETLDGPALARLIVAARGDPHKKVRRQAINALVCASYVPRCPVPDGLPTYDLVGLLLDRLRNDRSVSARRAAAAGLMYQVVLNGNRERRVRRGLQRAIATEQDEAIRRRAQQALSPAGGAEQTGPYAALEWALAERRVELALRLVRGHMRRWEVQGDFKEARRWLDRVLAISEGAPPSLRAPALHDAGFAALITGDFDAASRHLAASLAEWARSGQRAAGVRTKSLLTFLGSFGDDPTAIDALDAEVAEVRATGDDASLFDVLAASGQARMFRGAPDVARRHFEEAVAAAERAELSFALATGLVGLGSAEVMQGDFAAAEDHLVEGVSRSRANGDDHTELIGWCWMAELDRSRGDPHRARSRLEECMDRARAMAAPYPLAMVLLGAAGAAFEEGDTEAARSLFAEASAGAAAHLTHLVIAARIGQAEVALEGGDTTAAAKLLERAHADARRRGDAGATARCCYLLGQAARMSNHLQRAASLHDKALTLREAAGDRAGVADSLEALAGLAVAAGRDEKAARLFGAAQALRELTGAARGRLQTASYEADVARLRARTDADELLSVWGEGAAMPQAEAVWHARRGRGRRGRPRRGWEALTPAQRRVADLVTQGLSNAEVAERLFVGPETVKSHMAEVLAKLEMSSRWELRGARALPTTKD